MRAQFKRDKGKFPPNSLIEGHRLRAAGAREISRDGGGGGGEENSGGEEELGDDRTDETREEES